MKDDRVWQDYIVRTNARDALFKFLQEKGIETLINKYLFPSEFQIPEYTQYVGKTSLRLPIAPELTDAQIKYVITQIQNFYEKI
jgi:dTDP-4-amino-4,6-dideoxygalactose transaminase